MDFDNSTSALDELDHARDTILGIAEGLRLKAGASGGQDPFSALLAESAYVAAKFLSGAQEWLESYFDAVDQQQIR